MTHNTRMIIWNKFKGWNLPSCLINKITFSNCVLAEIKVSLSVTCSITSEATTQSKDSGSLSASSSTVMHLYCTFLATLKSCCACLKAACILNADASTPVTSAPSLTKG